MPMKFPVKSTVTISDRRFVKELATILPTAFGTVCYITKPLLWTKLEYEVTESYYRCGYGWLTKAGEHY